MSESLEPLILDFLEWLVREPRTHADVMDVWRTSCPRLTVWEDAVDRGLVSREANGTVAVTAKGHRLLDTRRKPAGPKQTAA
ncbi:MAG: hypothetical protein AB7O43_10165 [Hyphomicrobiaceae bacterium]